MTTVLSVYESALRYGAASLIHPGGRSHSLPVARWSGSGDDTDDRLLARCTGPTLDVGCGPGRLAATLTARGIPALGIDISAMAVRMTIARGALAIRRDVFATVPGENRWHHILLADGNIGIGGNPVRLLERCRELLTEKGSIVMDVEQPGTGVVIERVRLISSGTVSDPFRWCWLGVDALPVIAMAAGLAVTDVWLVGDRWQAELIRRP